MRSTPLLTLSRLLLSCVPCHVDECLCANPACDHVLASYGCSVSPHLPQHTLVCCLGTVGPRSTPHIAAILHGTLLCRWLRVGLRCCSTWNSMIEPEGPSFLKTPNIHLLSHRLSFIVSHTPPVRSLGGGVLWRHTPVQHTSMNCFILADRVCRWRLHIHLNSTTTAGSVMCDGPSFIPESTYVRLDVRSTR